MEEKTDGEEGGHDQLDVSWLDWQYVSIIWSTGSFCVRFLCVSDYVCDVNMLHDPLGLFLTEAWTVQRRHFFLMIAAITASPAGNWHYEQLINTFFPLGHERKIGNRFSLVWKRSLECLTWYHKQQLHQEGQHLYLTQNANKWNKSQKLLITEVTIKEN